MRTLSLFFRATKDVATRVQQLRAPGRGLKIIWLLCHRLTSYVKLSTGTMVKVAYEPQPKIHVSPYEDSKGARYGWHTIRKWASPNPTPSKNPQISAVHFHAQQGIKKVGKVLAWLVKKFSTPRYRTSKPNFRYEHLNVEEGLAA